MFDFLQNKELKKRIKNDKDKIKYLSCWDKIAEEVFFEDTYKKSYYIK